MSEYKVVFHVDEMSKWTLVLANTKNLKNALNQHTLQINILANSEAVRFLVASRHDDEDLKILSGLADENIIFSACNNSLRSLGIEPTALLSFVKVVPSGVAELTLLQHDNYAYIKP